MSLYEKLLLITSKVDKKISWRQLNDYSLILGNMIVIVNDEYVVKFNGSHISHENIDLSFIKDLNLPHNKACIVSENACPIMLVDSDYFINYESNNANNDNSPRSTPVINEFIIFHVTRKFISYSQNIDALDSNYFNSANEHERSLLNSFQIDCGETAFYDMRYKPHKLQDTIMILNAIDIVLIWELSNKYDLDDGNDPTPCLRRILL